MVERSGSQDESSLVKDLRRDLECANLQLRRYAEDIVQLYRSERKNRVNLEESQAQMTRYAEDLVRMYQIDSQKKNEIQDTNVQLRLYARDLSSIISNLRLANQNLKKAYQDTVLRLAMAAEFRDLDTGDHIVRIGRYCALLAEKAGLDKVFAELILYASPMHDLGKIGIPDSILLKNGALTQSEKVIMRAHPTIGARILGGSDSEILQMAHEIALTHHEQWDGNGYPYGLAGKDIPIAGRIAAIVDVFDALTSRRPYKEPFSVDESVRIMTTEMPTHFDPDLLQTFVAHVNEFVLIREAVEAEQIENVSRDSLFGKIADLKE